MADTSIDMKDFMDPMVALRVDVGAECGFEILVNDIQVSSAKYYSGGPFNGVIPISHYLVPDKNTVSVLIWPTSKFDINNEQGNANCAVGLIGWDQASMHTASEEAINIGYTELALHEAEKVRRGAGKLLAEEKRLNLLEGDRYSSSKRGMSVTTARVNYDEGLGWVIVREFSIKKNQPVYKSKYLTSRLITKDSNTYDSLKREYQKLWKILESKDFGQWEKLTKESFEEAAIMTNTTTEVLWAQGIGLKNILTGEDNNWDLIPLDFSKYELALHGNGRLTTIKKTNGWPILKYISKDGGTYSIYIPLLFRLDSNNNWVISRK